MGNSPPPPSGNTKFPSEIWLREKFVQLILMRIIMEIVATRCQILRLKCTKFRFRLGFCARPHWGSLQRSPRPLAGFEGPTSREGTERKGGEKRGGEGKGKKGKGRRRQWMERFPPGSSDFPQDGGWNSPCLTYNNRVSE